MAGWMDRFWVDKVAKVGGPARPYRIQWKLRRAKIAMKTLRSDGFVCFSPWNPSIFQEGPPCSARSPTVSVTFRCCQGALSP